MKQPLHTLWNKDIGSSRSFAAVAIVWVLFSGSLMFTAAQLSAQQSVGDPESLPLDSLLRADGSLRLDGSFTGTLDPSGYRMLLGPGGEPRFVRPSNPAIFAAQDTLDSMLKNYPGDEFWDESFGPPGCNGQINAVAVIGGQAYVGGRFTITGNTVAFNIARWDGRRWNEMQGGIGGTVRALAVHKGILYAGGDFAQAGDAQCRNIACYSPGTDRWSAIGISVGVDTTVLAPGSRTNGVVVALAFAGDDLVVVGKFDSVYTRAGGIGMSHVARWNGVRWYPLAQGIDAFPLAVAADTRDVFVGGYIWRPSGVVSRGVAQWDGTQWLSMAGGVHGAVHAICVTPADVFVGGTFDSAGSIAARNVARWNRAERRWYPVGSGLDDTVLALTFDGTSLYAGGAMRTSGETVVNSIARFDGSSWVSVGGGVADTTVPTVRSIAVGDDGIYVGGRFIIAGRISAHNAARWDGTRWYPLGRFDRPADDLNGLESSAYALALDDGRLYVGGDFDTAGGIAARRVAMWDGERWTPLGAGITGGRVRALAIGPSGELYAGGIFDEAGGIPVHGIACWNGRGWTDVGGGVGGRTPYVFALAPGGGGLFAAGAFTSAGGLAANRVAFFDFNSRTWRPLGSGLEGDSTEYVFVSCILRHGAAVIVGGDFARAGGARARRIAAWDGAVWTNIAPGPDDGANGLVSALAVHDSRLYAGGSFTRIGSANARYFARLQASGWEAVDTSNALDGPVRSLVSTPRGVCIGGLFHSIASVHPGNVVRYNGSSFDTLTTGVNGTVHALAAGDGIVYAGGDFTMAGPRKAAYVAGWDDVLWTSLGSDPSSGIYGLVRAIAVDGSDVYVGGAFTAVGGIRARNVARWDGRSWHPLGLGRANGVDAPVFALEPAPDGLYVGGAFTHAGTMPANYVARWNETGWSALNDGVGGVNPYVHALLLDGDDLYVGGVFTTADGLSVNRIARWSRAGMRWSALDSGVYGGSYYTYVSALYGNGSDLYVGGNFALAGSAPAPNIAHWDGQRWSGLGGGVNASVYEIIRFQDQIYACGDFTAAGGQPANHIARWNGSSWMPVTTGLNMRGTDMAIHKGELYVSGLFQMAGTALTFGVARWDGVRWDNLGKGLQNGYSPGLVYSIDAGDSGVYVGGDFTVAGGKASYYFGRWNGPGPTSSVVGGPEHSVVAAGSAALRCSPNPLAAVSAFDADVPVSGDARIDILDATGRTVATVDCGALAAGHHRIASGSLDLHSGLYFAWLRGDRYEASTWVLVQK